MNIIEAYTILRNKLIIVLVGIPGCGITKTAGYLSSKIQLPIINQTDYYKKDYKNMMQVSDTLNINNWDSPDAIDWDEFNKDVIEDGSEGIIVIMHNITKEFFQFEPDVCIELTINDDTCIGQKKLILKKENPNIPNKVVRLIYDNITLPEYNKSLENIEFDNKYTVQSNTKHDKLANTISKLIFNKIKNFFNDTNNHDKMIKVFSNQDNTKRLETIHKQYNDWLDKIDETSLKEDKDTSHFSGEISEALTSDALVSSSMSDEENSEKKIYAYSTKIESTVSITPINNSSKITTSKTSKTSKKEDENFLVSPNIPEESPSKPETSEESPSKSETSEESPSKPETSEESPSKPETSEESPSKPETSEESSSKPETSEESPSKPETSEESSSKPKTSEESSSKPETSEESSSKPETSEESSSKPKTSEEDDDFNFFEEFDGDKLDNLFENNTRIEIDDFSYEISPFK